MGKAKRGRKIRMRNHRWRKLVARMSDLSAWLDEQRGRGRLRRQILATAMPEPAKEVLAMLVDPVGHTTEIIARVAEKHLSKPER